MASVSLDDLNRPTVEVTVIGPKGEKAVTAVIDTGFSGFLSVPSDVLQTIGLPQKGQHPITGRAVLADNQKVDLQLCLGAVRIDQETMVDAFVIAPEKAEVLLGMGFLLAFRKTLVVDVIDMRVELNPTSCKPK